MLLLNITAPMLSTTGQQGAFFRVPVADTSTKNELPQWLYKSTDAPAPLGLGVGRRPNMRSPCLFCLQTVVLPVLCIVSHASFGGSAQSSTTNNRLVIGLFVTTAPMLSTTGYQGAFFRVAVADTPTTNEP